MISYGGYEKSCTTMANKTAIVARLPGQKTRRIMQHS